MVSPGESGWSVRTAAKLPFVHRFDIITRDGISYVIACTLKSGHEYKEDWRSPGKVYVCRLPENIEPLGIVALGEPTKERPANDRYLDEQVFFNTYGNPWEK